MRYGLDWVCKEKVEKMIKENNNTILKEDEEWNKREENKDSQNLLIKGDNLEVLKHLLDNYYQKIKMIYIDPPYNTCKKRGYKDCFSKDYLIKLGCNKDVLKQFKKKELQHSAWLTFMYPRLYIARRLLRDDGVIFVSIDDNEVAQLRLLMDEIFGEENFRANFIWKGRSGAEDDKDYRRVHEYILVYSTTTSFKANLKENTNQKFNKYDTVKKRRYKLQLLRKWGDNSRREDRPNLYYPIKDPDGNDFFPKLPDGSDGCWRWGKSTMQKAIEEGLIEFAYNRKGELEAYERVYEPSESEVITKKYHTLLLNNGDTSFGTKQLKEIFGTKVFDRPKPTTLIKELLKRVFFNRTDLIILDFFAGSGTTGDAVMQLNVEDGGNRKYILVQIPEPIDPKKNKTAYDFVKNELGEENPTIFHICKERLVRAGKKIKEENKEKDLSNVDFGFKIFEIKKLK